MEVPAGRMVDPHDSLFWVSWQDWDDATRRGQLLESTDVRGADAAIAWGRERATVVLIRLGHSGDTYFSAGENPAPSVPSWPPETPSSEGWFTPAADEH
jgi:hypothetical protein